MAWSDPETRKKYIRQHYQDNKEYYKQKRRDQNERLRQQVRDIKDAPCTDCGQRFHYSAMDFDHISDDKVTAVSTMAGRGSLRKVLEEIDKCELVCSNCHRYRTWLRNNTPS